MAVNVAASAWVKKFWIYDAENDKYEEKFRNVRVQEWEIEKVDGYFKDITQIIQKSIDSFYLIVHWSYYNEIRQKFFEISKNYGIKNFHIISDYQVTATLALKYIHANADSLWLFTCYSYDLICAIWEINKEEHQLRISKFITQKRTNRGQNVLESDLEKLKKKIRCNSTSPIIISFNNLLKFRENTFKNIFNNYQEIYFDYSVSSFYEFLLITEKQKKKEILEEVQLALGRIIFIKYEETIIASMRNTCVIPFQKDFKLNIKHSNTQLKIYENEVLTQTVILHERGTALLNFNIDKNGIFTLTIERKKTNVINFPISKAQNKNTFKIPSKVSTYDRELNAVGIDLGTAECCAFVIRRNGPDGVVLDPVTNQRNLLSYVAVNELNYPCGQLIINRMEEMPDFTAFDVKRLIGKELNEIIIDPLWPFEVINYCGQIHLILNKVNNPWIKSCVKILSYLLKQIKSKVEEYQGTKLEEAVITVPSTFTDKQKSATMDAAKLARWETIHFLPEPVAALIAYTYENDIPNEANVFLFDCGDGTTDICIAKILNGNIEILSENGDSFFGGKEFDRILIYHFANQLKQKYKIDVFEGSKKYRLMKKCREIKHTLSVEQEGLLYVDDFVFNCDDVLKITRQEFEKLAEKLIIQGKHLIEKSMEKSQLHQEDIDIVFQAGGGCRVPMIKEMLKEMFPKAQHQCSIHPEELVAKGAALYAYELKTNKEKK